MQGVSFIISLLPSTLATCRKCELMKLTPLPSLFGLGFFALFSAPIFTLTRAVGRPDGGAAAISFLLQIVAFIIVLVILVRIYGHAYAKSPPSQ